MQEYRREIEPDEKRKWGSQREIIEWKENLDQADEAFSASQTWESRPQKSIREPCIIRPDEGKPLKLDANVIRRHETRNAGKRREIVPIYQWIIGPERIASTRKLTFEGQTFWTEQNVGRSKFAFIVELSAK